jgi:hypothetical protein
MSNDEKKTDVKRNAWKAVVERWELNRRQVQSRILAIPGSHRALRKLTTEGANRERVLSLLADTVEELNFWQKPVRRIKAELLSVAIQLETLAEHAERISLDTSFSGSFWLAALGLGK